MKWFRIRNCRVLKCNKCTHTYTHTTRRFYKKSRFVAENYEFSIANWIDRKSCPQYMNGKDFQVNPGRMCFAVPFIGPKQWIKSVWSLNTYINALPPIKPPRRSIVLWSWLRTSHYLPLLNVLKSFIVQYSNYP